MSTTQKPSINPIAIIALGVTSVSFAAIFVRISTAPAPVIAFWRLFIATAVTALISIRSGTLLKIPARKDLMLTGLAGCFLAFHFWSWFQSLKMTTVASSTVLVATQPLFVILAARIVWKEKLSARAGFGLAVALVGTVFIACTTWTNAGRLSGNLLAVLAAIFASGYLMVGTTVRTRMEVNLYTFWTYLFCTLALMGIVASGGYAFGPYLPINWFTFAMLGIVCHIGGHTSFNWAIGYVSPSVVSTAILGEPVGAALWAAMFFGEIPSLGEVLGGILVIAGLFVFMSRTSTKTQNG